MQRIQSESEKPEFQECAGGVRGDGGAVQLLVLHGEYWRRDFSMFHHRFETVVEVRKLVVELGIGNCELAVAVKEERITVNFDEV